MRWLVENWSLLVIVVCVVAGYALYAKRFAALPREEQIAKVKEWLLFAVIEAEKEYGSGTGALKLRSVYNDFCCVFPTVAEFLSFELFSALVDEALDEMKALLQYNKDIAAYVEEEDI